MGFGHQGLWVMGYGLQIPAHQLSGPERVWNFRAYGLSNAWVMRVSTVVHWGGEWGIGGLPNVG